MLRRRTPLRPRPETTAARRRRSAPLEPGSPPVRRTPVNPINRKRLTMLRREQFGSQSDYVRTLACIVPGCADSRIEAAHARSRGAGGRDEDTFPACTVHHAEQHQLGVRTWGRKYGLDLDTAVLLIRRQMEERAG